MTMYMYHTLLCHPRILYCTLSIRPGYEKDQYWAGCRQSCQPGEVNPTDPIETWRSDWGWTVPVRWWPYKVVPSQ